MVSCGLIIIKFYKMEELKKYLNYQIEHLEKWDENKTLSEYGK